MTKSCSYPYGKPYPKPIRDYIEGAIRLQRELELATRSVGADVALERAHRN